MFNEPDDNTIIWRYMNVSKFLSLITISSLHFVRVNELEDPYEGYYTEKDINEFNNRFLKEKVDRLKESKRRQKYVMFVNCWHINDYESGAMWKIYTGHSNDGIAIKTNFKKLKSSILIPNESEQDLLGPFYHKIEYKDYTKDKTKGGGNIFKHFLQKRKSFDFEQELRAIIWNPMNYEKQKGIFIPVDLHSLIKEIYIAPKADPWIKETIIELLYNLKLDKLKRHVKQSHLYGPIF